MITQDRLRHLLDYNPISGNFNWLNPQKMNKARKGDAFGGLTDKGYLRAKLDDKNYYLHKLAFLYMTGYLPTEQIDHKNRVRSDNRWENLRLSSPQENGRNRSAGKNSPLGVKGLTLREDGGTIRFVGTITGVDGERLFFSRAFVKGDLVSQAKACAAVENWLREMRDLHHREFSHGE